MIAREPWEFSDDRLATWQRTGGPSERARRTAAHPARYVAARLAVRLVLAVFGIAFVVVEPGAVSALFAVWWVGTAGFVIWGLRRSLSTLADDVAAWDAAVARGEIVPGDLPDPMASRYHPARIRQAGWERRGGPSRLDRWRAAAPWRAGVLEALAWLVPVGLGLVTLLVATDQPARTTWFVTGFVMIVAGPVLVLGLHERARLTAVAMDLPPSHPDAP